MKKDKLIEMLQKIEGNPEILFWNPFVEDWQNISKNLIQDKQVKETPNEVYRKMWDLQRLERNQNPVTDEEWLNKLNDLKKGCNFVQTFKSNIWNTEYDKQEKFSFYDYKYRDVVYLQMSLRNKKAYDRAGSIEY